MQTKDLPRARITLSYKHNPMHSIGVKFEVTSEKLTLNVMPLKSVKGQLVMCSADDIPADLYKLGSIIHTRFQAWWESSSEPLDTILREIRDCNVEVFYVSS